MWQHPIARRCAFFLPLVALAGCQTVAPGAPVGPASEPAAQRQLLSVSSWNGCHDHRERHEGRTIPIAVGPDIEDQSAVAFDSRRSTFLVAWVDLTQGAGDIYVRRVGREGRALGPAIAVATGPANQLHPRLAYDPHDDAFLLVWTEGTVIMARHLKPNGQPLSDPFTVPAAPAGNENNADVAFDPTRDEFLVTWDQFVAPGSTIEARRVAATGTGLGTDLLVSAATGNNVTPALVFNRAAREFFVVWGANDTSILGRRIASGGTFASDILQVDDGVPSQKFQPDVALNTCTNKYLVVWSDNRNPATPPQPATADIFARRLTATGTPDGGAFFVAGTPTTNDGEAQLAYNANTNRFLLAWLQIPALGGGPQLVEAERLNGAGKPTDGAFTVVNDQPTIQVHPAVASETRGDDVLVTLTDTRQVQPSNTNVLGRLVDMR